MASTKMEKNAEVESAKNRLLKISVMASACLLINLTCTVVTSVHIDEWARTSDIWLDCSLFETWNSKHYEVYELVNGQTICAKEDVNFLLKTAPCQSDCIFVDSENQHFSSSSFQGGVCTTEEVPKSSDDYNLCDCPCKFWVEVTKPSVAVLGLGFFAQALVTCMVGIALGFRYRRTYDWTFALPSLVVDRRVHTPVVFLSLALLLPSTLHVQASIRR